VIVWTILCGASPPGGKSSEQRSPLNAANPADSAITLTRTSHILVGFLASGELVVADGHSDDDAAVEAVTLPKGPARALYTRSPRVHPSEERARLGISPPKEARHIDVGRAAASGDRRAIARFALDGRAFDVAIEVDRTLGDRRALHVVAAKQEERIELAIMRASSAIDVGPLYIAPGDRYGVLALSDRGRRGLEVVDFDAAESALLGLEGLLLLQSEARTEASERLREAVRIDPKNGDAHYNLACANALLGDEAGAWVELKIALSLDPLRYTRIARIDPDLEGLRTASEVWQLTFPKPRGYQQSH
jgi:hypothetical protein